MMFRSRPMATPFTEPTDQQLVAQAYRRVRLAKAVAWLGMRWRGQPRCTHRYRNSDGVEVRKLWP